MNSSYPGAEMAGGRDDSGATVRDRFLTTE
jgi:hypothetical protein